MRVLIIALMALVVTAAPSMAETERGYVSGTAGFASSHDGTSGDMIAEAGVRLVPHLLLFGSVGRFHNLQPSQVQPAVDQAVSAVTSIDAVSLQGTARVPAWYSTTNAFLFTWGGGLGIPVARHVTFDAGYRFSHVAADTPINAQGATFGLGYRF